MSEVEKKTLLTILQQRDEILAEIAEKEGEIDSYAENLLVGNEAELAVKLEGYRDIIKEFETKGEQYDIYAKAFAKRSKALFGAAKRLLENAKHLLIHAEIQNVSGLTCSFKIKRVKNSVIVDETADFEALFKAGSPFIVKKEIYVADKEVIRKALEYGGEVSFAKLDQGFSLEIADVPNKLLKGEK
jgi:hypothetical protein